MRYFGGKMKIAGKVADYLASQLNGRDYYEPFCGACNVTVRMSNNRTCSDVHPALITLWQQLQAGWNPPDNLSEEEYRQLKLQDDPLNPLTAFAGFGCSFAGKYFGGYARDDRGRNYAKDAKSSLLKKLDKLRDVKFLCQSYSALDVSNAFIYCDPPYEATTAYKGTPKLDHALFWDWVRAMSKTNTVLVSSYAAPEDFTSVLNIATVTEIRTNAAGREARIEKVFKLC